MMKLKKLTKTQLIEICDSFVLRGTFGCNGYVSYQIMKKSEIIQSIFNYKTAIKTIENILKEEFHVDSIIYDDFNYGFEFEYDTNRYCIHKELINSNEIFISNGNTCFTLANDEGDAYVLKYEINIEYIKKEIRSAFKRKLY